MNSNKRLSLFFGVIGVILGVVLTLVGILYYEEFVQVICIFIGAIIILVNIFPLLISAKEMKHSKRYAYNFIVSLSFIILGAIFIFNHGFVLSVILGSLLIIFPLIRIILARDHKRQFLTEIPLLALGIALFFNAGDLLFQIALITFGIVLAVLSLINIVLLMIHTKSFEDTVIDVESEEVE
ncbi:hypothetical protein EI71_01987 [Anaeroplasma bactoclasticum]|jgi:hypothetical protein|uniref:DUF308 domain-containing protein n=1 Tax=Anaeroplasma bactoclasticum TaxID=2088 RepID=A0A397R2S6_9MOLU|nr:hypothetical protein [Anaeroplasma bactoclasticum]RIA64721.1 hypothetical protein EI71_01987 [Anaeroplasma bactoclasticum]